MITDVEVKVKCLEIAQQSNAANILDFAKQLFEWVKG